MPEGIRVPGAIKLWSARGINCQAGLKDIPPHLVAFGESSAFFFCHSY
ncbi:MAG: hypothetical protein WBI12_02650 [Methanosarcina flavescens]